MNKYTYPFSAIVGQEKLKKALLINLVNPLVGGLLISGEKGTGKSTIVRGIKNLVPGIKVIELPLNTTEDRLIGAIDIEKAILNGERDINNSILMEADKNILYVDEVNLLNENIVNSLLEVSESGICKVEREGISLNYESDFILIGTMNPEEGGIRPQFIDRFGLYVDIIGNEELDERIEIIKRRVEYEENPALFIEKWKEKEEEILVQIEKAKEKISNIEVSENIMKLASQISMEGNCSGHRAEIIMVEAAKAIAALDGRENIKIEDLKEAAELALPHRIRELPPNIMEEQEEDEAESPVEESEENKENKENEEHKEPEEENPIEESQGNGEAEDRKELEDNKELNDNEESEDNMEDLTDSPNVDEDTIDKIGKTFKIRDLDIKPPDRKKRKGSGRRAVVKTDRLQGRYIKHILPKNKEKDIAFDATLRAAAPFQNTREKNGLALAIRTQDLREKVREKPTGSTILFIVDASGSMGAEKRMEAVKGAIMSLLTDAYEKRDSVGMVAFRKEEAELILGITRSIDLAYKKLEALPTGGKTPLVLGMYRGYEILKASMKKDPDIIPIMVLVSDGRGNVSFQGGDPHGEALEIAEKIAIEGIQSIIIDTEDDFIKLNLAKEIGEYMKAKYYKLEDLKADEIYTIVKNNVDY